MSDDPKQSESFLRKVARFVANPTTDWKEINSRQDDPESELARAELKAMIERKRRNDFVRKREFDMLRRLRREGLTPEQLAAAGAQANSVMGEGERPSSEMSKDEQGAVRDKINLIEQEMAKEGFRPSSAPRPKQASDVPDFGATTTNAAHFAPTQPAANLEGGAPTSPAADADPSNLLTLPPLELGLNLPELSQAQPTAVEPDFELVLDASPPSEQQELEHDPELDEAVIAFANGDNETCEHSLTVLTQQGGARHGHADTWMVRFDFYRATGQHQPFEALALDYVHLFGLSAPQWFSIPKMIADSRRLQERPAPAASATASTTWTSPAVFDLDAQALLKKRCDSAPLPWVFDWSAVERIEAEAREPLTDLMRAWAKQPIEMRWLQADRLLSLLNEATPVGERDVDTGWWMLRLETLRVLNRPDQFDEAAIDYCVTYEVSPPSWDMARCKVRGGSGGHSTLGPPSQASGDGGLAFLDSTTMDEGDGGQVAHLEMSGQLVGDITEMLRSMTAQIGGAVQVQVACPKLLRLDFIAAGDLLNWVLNQRSENRTVVFVDAHRLVALFFGAMGINEHSRIKIRAV
ncbi:hypothetical protein [Inhella gelatinilytica]|uniref:STAS domain-containing protein n=1 Tax=Inhella gelatinilytica TaxID=2795030 RepID=A0A931IUL6_9BURK|nr:hypothetical protein [Inhella gelatinilytica]MBH9551295.1 hypothetical protein [Inhella gelatinilytica]